MKPSGQKAKHRSGQPEYVAALNDFFPRMRPERASYLVNFSRRHRFLYVETPKVGCSTIKRTLQRIELGPESVPLTNVHDRGSSPLASPATDLPGFLLAQYDPEFVRFSFVRNPFSRIVSCYLDKVVKTPTEKARLMPELGLDPNGEISLEEFLKAIRRQKHADMDIHWLPQSIILEGLRRPSFIGRFECFNEHLALVLKIVAGRAKSQLERHSPHTTGASAKIQDLVRGPERDLIAEIYEKDFIQFGYSMDLRFAI
jgi:hypothetical protein